MNATPQSPAPLSRASASNTSFPSPLGGGETSEPLASAPYETHRRLDEPVLPSAAEEALVDTTVLSGVSVGSGTAAWPFPDGSPSGNSDDAGRWLNRMEDQVTRYVATEPVKAALIAVGVGAVTTLLLGRSLSRTRRERRG